MPKLHMNTKCAEYHSGVKATPLQHAPPPDNTRGIQLQLVTVRNQSLLAACSGTASGSQTRCIAPSCTASTDCFNCWTATDQHAGDTLCTNRLFLQRNGIAARCPIGKRASWRTCRYLLLVTFGHPAAVQGAGASACQPGESSSSSSSSSSRTGKRLKY
jgi:hypothetical protein